MALNTKAFDAQDALLTALRDAPDLAGWSICYGLPAGRPDERHLWIDETVQEWSQDGETSGLLSKDESFRLSVYVYSRRTDATAEEVRDEIKAAAGAVADIVGAAPFLGGVVLYARISGAEYEGAFADSDGRQREGVMRLDVTCSAFLTGA